jgi:hypothetical protein
MQNLPQNPIRLINKFSKVTEYQDTKLSFTCVCVCACVCVCTLIVIALKRYLYIMEFYSVTKRNEILSFAENWRTSF